MVEALLMERPKVIHYMSLPLTAEYVGSAREGHGDNGSLYEVSNGNTYFVPFVRSGGKIIPMLSETEQVKENPTGFYGDMRLIPVPKSDMDAGLRTALERAISDGHPKAIAEQRLAFG